MYTSLLQSSFAVVTQIQQNSNDGRLKRFSDYKKEKLVIDNLVNESMLGLKQIKVVEGEKEYTYPVDLLANAVTELMLEQDKTLSAVDLDKIRGLPRQQPLNLLDDQEKLKHGSKLINAANKQINDELGQKYLDSLKSLLLKINTLGITKIFHPSLPLQ